MSPRIGNTQLAHSRNPCETLLWIGERDADEFRNAFDFCESQAAQLAFRRDVNCADNPIAALVDRIVVARVDRSPLSTSLVKRLQAVYPAARWLSLEGPLCAGASLREPSRAIEQTCPLHQWRQVLPHWLTNLSVDNCECPPTSSVALAIVSASADTSNTLVELAGSSGVAAACFAQASPMQMRNFDVVWWDDSVAGPATVSQWRERLCVADQPSSLAIRPFARSAVHVWLTNSRDQQSLQAAQNAGVTTVFTKPYLLRPLLESVSVLSSRESPVTMLQGHRAA